MKKIMTISLLLAMYVLSVSAQCENCSNEAIKNIMTRTSIRQYTDEPVSKADIETMLRAGMAAPTAVNRQPWHFVVINIDYETIGANGSMLMVATSGTAVVI